MTTYTGVTEISLFGTSHKFREESTFQIVDNPTVDASGNGTFVPVDQLARTPKTHTTAMADDYIQFGSEWFERNLVKPGSFELGNILSDQSLALEIFSTYRKDKQQLVSFTNNAGDGIELTGITTPYQMELFEDVSGTLEVSTTGPANVDSNLEFEFTSETVITPISLQRILLFPLIPELPYKERLEWMTDVMRSEDGSEQRLALREHPRQYFNWKFRMVTDERRRKIENQLIDFMGRTFGIPMWHESMALSSAITAGDTTINLVSTEYTDLRDGGLVVIFQDEDTFDVSTVVSHTSNSITLASEVQGSYGLDAQVLPLRAAVIDGKITGSQYTVNALDLKVNWRVTDNVNDIASLGTLDTYSGSPILSQKNIVGNQGIMRTGYDRKVVKFDGDVGKVMENPIDRVATHLRTKGFRAVGKQGLWELRQMLYAIKGRQLSFYMPSDLPEFTLALDIAATDTTMLVEGTGYAKHVRAEGPYNVVRLTLTDGTEVVNTITAAVANNDGTETFTMANEWDSDILVASVAKVDILEKVRFDTDNLTIEHLSGGYVKRIGAPVRGVIE